MAFSSFEDEYRALTEGIAWRKEKERGKVAVLGVDRITFLHSMISHDVSSLDEYQGRYGTFLTATGKIVADFYYYRLPEQVLIDLSTAASSFIEALEKFIIMDEVELQDISASWRHFSIHGQRSREFLADLFNTFPPEQSDQVVPCSWQAEELFWIRRDELSTPGYVVLLSPEGGDKFASALTESTAIEVGDEAFNVVRLERGLPLFGRDFTEKNNPLEARLDYAVSLSKGCYIGQEVIARASHIGGVPRLLSKLNVDGDRVPGSGSRVMTDDGKEAGKVTSAAYSPRLGRVIAFAYIKRALSQTGNRLQVDLDGRLVSAEIVDRFL